MRATRAVIHLDHLVHNLNEIRKLAGPDVRLCLPVKAAAYGHGAAPVAKCALENGVSVLAVATVDEGLELRAAGISAPVLLFSVPDDAELEALARARLTPFVSEPRLVLQLEKAAAAVLSGGDRLAVHLKVETGMGRTGCAPDSAGALAEVIRGCPHLTLGGMATHFAAADSLAEEDVRFTQNQLAEFLQAADTVRAAGINPGILHAAASAGALTLPAARLDMIRPGIAAYGYAPSGELAGRLDLRPVMELQTEVTFVKDWPEGASVSYGRTWRASAPCRIATLAVGYADGFRRSFSPGCSVEIHGVPCPVRGRICMDQCMVEIPPQAGNVVPGTPAVVFGPSPCRTSAADLAALAGTIPYEITCGISHRVPRVYTG